MAIKPEFIIRLQGRDYPTWPGVLDAAHRAGLREMTTKLLQIPNAENGGVAIVEATAVFTGEDGRDRVFIEIGDASAANVNPKLVSAIIRLAATRAKGRACRDATNTGATMFEELPGNDHEEETTSGRRGDHGAAGPPLAAAGTAAARPDRPLVRYEPGSAGETAREVVADESAVPKFCTAEGCGLELTGGQGKLSLRLFGKGLCPAHQTEARKQQAA